MLDVVRDLYPDDFVILGAANNRCTLDLNTGARYITTRTYTLLQQFAILTEDTETFGVTRANYLLYPNPII
jgi:hypothetical protein